MRREINFCPVKSQNIGEKVKEFFTNLVMPKMPLGLRIDNDKIMMCQLEKQNDGAYCLKTLNFCFLPVEQIDDTAKLIVQKISELKRLNNLTRCKVNSVSPSHDTILKKLSLPQMSEEELQEVLHWKAEQYIPLDVEQYIPFDINDVYLDATIIKPNAGHRQMDILLAAAKKEVINDHFSWIEEAGFKPNVFEPICNALIRAVSHNYGISSDETIAIINVGYSSTDIVICRGNIIMFTRDLSHGTGLIFEELKKELGEGVTLTEAITLYYDNLTMQKIIYGREKAIEKLSKKKPEKELDDEVLKAIEKVSAEEKNLEEPDPAYLLIKKAGEKAVNNLAVDIQGTLDFFLVTSMTTKIEKTYLCGEDAHMPLLVELVKKRLEQSVTIVDPFLKIKIDEEKCDRELLERFKSSATIAVGLALREGSPTQKRKIPAATKTVKSFKPHYEKAKKPQKKLKVSEEEILQPLEDFSLLYSSGAPILDSLETIASNGMKKELKEAFCYVKDRIAKGTSIASPLEECGFPDRLVKIINVGESTGALGTIISKYCDFIRLRKKIKGINKKDKELLEFAAELAMLVDAGLPLVQGLDLMAAKNKTSYNLWQIRSDVENGYTFADALERAKFPKIFVNLVRAGAINGILNVVLNRFVESRVKKFVQ